MTSDRWNRVRALFEQVIDCEPAEADALLAKAAAGDPALRDEVRSLLEHHTRAGAFLEEPVTARLPAWEDDEGLAPGAVVGAYTIVREIGRGGMGRVYLATDGRLGRAVALKALPPALTRDPVHRERLTREARAAAALTHPGICTVYALEEHGDALFIATEFVDGRTLRDEIGSGVRPPADRVQATLRELAAALASAHERGIVHRDLKPENIMRTSDGRVKILDFGLARLDAAPGPVPGLFVTKAGAVLGTPAYMAPEQLNGQPADTRADVFAFGIVAYEYACGEHPFAAPTELALVARLLESRSQPLAARCPHLPLALAGVVDKSLSKAPHDRFASAVEIAAALASGAAPLGPGISIWWRTHQVAMMVVYIAATFVAWQIKEAYPSRAALWMFVAIGIGAAAAGIIRGHLVFTEQMNRTRLHDERRRTATALAAADLLMAVALAADALTFVEVKPLYAMLTMALALGIALAALIMEPATTAAAFGGE